jgi:hypothetical protein
MQQMQLDLLLLRPNAGKLSPRGDRSCGRRNFIALFQCRSRCCPSVMGVLCSVRNSFPPLSRIAML